MIWQWRDERRGLGCSRDSSTPRSESSPTTFGHSPTRWRRRRAGVFAPKSHLYNKTIKGVFDRQVAPTAHVRATCVATHANISIVNTTNCDERVCFVQLTNKLLIDWLIGVCVSIHENISGIICPNFTKFSLHVVVAWSSHLDALREVIGPILWGHSGLLCHALSLLSSSSLLLWTSMRRRCATVAACDSSDTWWMAI